MNTRLVLGGNRIDRHIEDAEGLLEHYKKVASEGYEYKLYLPHTPNHQLFAEDLAVTLLVSSRADYKAFQSLRDFGATINLLDLPSRPLQDLSDSELQFLAQFIGGLTRWPGFQTALATKVLHKKRSDLIPVLDNQAIFWAYMQPRWPELRADKKATSVSRIETIHDALQRIRFDLVRAENTEGWSRLQRLEPTLTRIQLFDSVWWGYFKEKEPSQVK